MYDVCIVGSGAGGAPVAYELSKAGYDVVVLEKGKYYHEEDMDKDELAVCRRDKFTPSLKDEYHIINDFEDGKYVRYNGAKYNWNFWNGSMVGGSSNLMSGYFHQLKPTDFKLLSTYGEIEGANVVDWVIEYDELKPYYDKVKRVVGVSGTHNFPYPPLQTNKVTKWFDKACTELGYDAFETPRAILSVAALGRNSCSYSNFCGSYGCATGAKGSARAALLQKCDATIITEAFVYRLDSAKNRVTKAYYYDKEKKSHTIEAKIFVLAAQAIETSRLLLNSANTHFPNGLANNSNQVGKNLIFSAGGVGGGRFRFENLTKKQQDELMEQGVFFNRSMQEYEFEMGSKKYKGGTIDFLFEHANIISRVNRLKYDKEGNILWGKKLQEKIHKDITTSRVLNFEVFNDWLPTDKCFVSVDKDAKDKYGVNVASINLFSHPHDIKVGKHLAKRAKDVLKQMGAKEIYANISPSPPPNLVAGGCRFGKDPKSSVLDKNCKAHELDNLYVTDASFMPTGGSVPYTWSIYANSFRVADILKGVL